MIRCELCGANLSEGKECRDLYDELAFYTLKHPDQRYFIHQLIVDAYGAQHITKDSKPVAIFAALVGLYLFAEKGFTGKEVQDMHVKLGNKMKEYKLSTIASEKASINIADVLAIKEGIERDEMIKAWARAVWQMWKSERGNVIAFYNTII